MKKIRLTVDIVCKDTTSGSDLVSDIEDSLLCDNVKKGIIEYDDNGTLETSEFENPDFEE